MLEQGALAFEDGDLEIADGDERPHLAEVDDADGDPAVSGEEELPRNIEGVPWSPAAFVRHRRRCYADPPPMASVTIQGGARGTPPRMNDVDDEAGGLPAPWSALAGFLMGAADSVPGVSGGTIALIVGVYERLIDSISRVLRTPILVRTVDGRQKLGAAFGFLVPLVLGLAAAYYLGTLILVGREAEPGLIRRADTAPLCYAFFFGLVLASLREPWRRIGKVGPTHVLAALVAAVGAAAFIGLPHTRGEPPTWALVYGGALAVGVMLLPGVSGSLLLVVLGQYTKVAGAVHDRELGVFAVFLGGVALGVLLFVPFLRHLLRRHHDLTMAALTGLMAGSLRALWPWKDNYDPKLGPMGNLGVGSSVGWVLLAVLAGFVAAWLLSRLEARMKPA